MSVPREGIPQKVGRYVIVDAVGFGAMGAVYRAFDPLIKRTVAIKTIRLDVPPQTPQYRSFLERFYTEVRISGTLSHPNIVTLYDIGESEEETPFLAMEFVEGETIAELLDGGGRLHPEQVIGLVSQVASAVDYAHGKGVIHRDIKPSNIIVHDGEKVKVTDFGIAKLMDAEVTQTGTLLGTPSYMSPEQAMGEPLDGRTDIFSLGVVAFEMLSGEQPFPGNNVTSILYKLVHSDPVRPQNLEVLGLLPDRWHQVFSKVLSKNPADRYQSAADFVSELELCLGSWFGALEGETVVMPGEEAFPPPARGRPVREKDKKAAGPEVAAPRAAPPEDVASETEEEDETVLLRPPSSPKPPVTETLEIPRSQLGTQAGAEPPAETVLLSFDETQTAVSDRSENAGGGTLGPTAGATPPPTATFGATMPIEPHSRPRRDGSPRLRGKHWLLAGVGGVAALAVALGALIVIVALRRIEPIGALPPVSPLASGLSSAEPLRGSLRVQTTPEGATVWVDGEERGTTPFELEGLERGTYLVRLEKEGYLSEELPARIARERPRLSMRLDLKQAAAVRAATPPARRPAYVTVESEPAGARVLVDGKPVGETPLERFRLEPGKAIALAVQKEGFRSWEQVLEAKPGAAETITARLEPEAPPVAPEPSPPSPPRVRPGELVEPGPGVTEPKCIKCPGVAYPDVARKAKLQGAVLVSFIVTETGEVENIEILESGGEIFDRAVVETLRLYRYEPPTKEGVPVKMRKVLRHRFQIGR